MKAQGVIRTRVVLSGEWARVWITNDLCVAAMANERLSLGDWVRIGDDGRIYKTEKEVS